MRIVFCGACNPVFSLNDLALKVRQEFPDDTDDADGILLLLNGCKAGCLKPKNFTPGHTGTVCVAGTCVDGFDTEEYDLCNAVMNAIMKKVN